MKYMVSINSKKKTPFACLTYNLFCLYWGCYKHLIWLNVPTLFQLHNSAKLQSPHSVLSFRSCDKVNHKQDVCFRLYLLGQIVTWQSQPYSIELISIRYSYNWSTLTVGERSTVICMYDEVNQRCWLTSTKWIRFTEQSKPTL